MARPPKKELAFYRRDTSTYDDIKIILLKDRYGPVGFMTYDVIITDFVYKRGGYYFDLCGMPVDIFAHHVVERIGNKWAKASTVTQAILFCADIGLFDHDLLTQGIITSVGIQRRYQEVTARNKVDKSKYWLIDDDGQPLVSEPKNNISATKTLISATKTPISATKIQQSKVNVNENVNYYCDSACACEESDEHSLKVVDKQYGKVMLSEVQIKALLENLTLDEYDYYVDKLGAFITDKNAHVKNHYTTILKWVMEDRKNSGGNNG